MRPNGIVTLTTDFGTTDSYVGMLKGVLLRTFPHVQIVDITHDIRPQDVAHAAYMVETFHRYFPIGTTHLVIVDPGVGSTRRAMALQTPEAQFVGPDNGAFTAVWHDAQERWPAEQCRAVELTEKRFWLPQVSNTFHGRDVFAPVAAHLASGTPIGDVGRPLGNLSAIDIDGTMPGRTGGLAGKIVHVDHFGNCVTTITPRHLEEAGMGTQFVVEIIDQRISSLCRTYADSQVGAVMALIGSSGRLELAVRNGSAAQTLGVGVGDRVHVKRPEDVGRRF